MTSIEKAIAKAREIEERATPGPWSHTHIFDGEEVIHEIRPDGSLGSVVAYTQSLRDGKLTEHARNTHRLTWDVVEASQVFLDDFLSKKTCAPGAVQRALDALARAVLASEKGGE